MLYLILLVAIHNKDIWRKTHQSVDFRYNKKTTKTTKVLIANPSGHSTNLLAFIYKYNSYIHHRCSKRAHQMSTRPFSAATVCINIISLRIFLRWQFFFRAETRGRTHIYITILFDEKIRVWKEDVRANIALRALRGSVRNIIPMHSTKPTTPPTFHPSCTQRAIEKRDRNAMHIYRARRFVTHLLWGHIYWEFPIDGDTCFINLIRALFEMCAQRYGINGLRVGCVFVAVRSHPTWYWAMITWLGIVKKWCNLLLLFFLS